MISSIYNVKILEHVISLFGFTISVSLSTATPTPPRSSSTCYCMMMLWEGKGDSVITLTLSSTNEKFIINYRFSGLSLKFLLSSSNWCGTWAMPLTPAARSSQVFFFFTGYGYFASYLCEDNRCWALSGSGAAMSCSLMLWRERDTVTQRMNESAKVFIFCPPWFFTLGALCTELSTLCQHDPLLSYFLFMYFLHLGLLWSFCISFLFVF